jgi:hypothetical protein
MILIFPQKFFYQLDDQASLHQVDGNSAEDCSHQDHISQIEHSHPCKIRQGEHPHNSNKMGEREQYKCNILEEYWHQGEREERA